MSDIDRFFDEQLAVWPQVKQRYDALFQAESKEVSLPDGQYTVTFNPSRIRSARADVKEGRTSAPCFLCDEALPHEQQKREFKVVPSGRTYWLMVNPYPITDRHFTIVSTRHEPQQLLDASFNPQSAFRFRTWDMASLADSMPDYLIFFNGACSGASAPQHMHFQAVPKSEVPITGWSWQQLLDMGVTDQMPSPEVLLDADHCNIVCWTEGATCHWLVIRRKAHRPSQYFLPEGENLLISPAALEFCGLVPMARREDYDRMDAALLSDIFEQCRQRTPMRHILIEEGAQICFTAEERLHALNYLDEGRILHVMDYGSNRAEKHEITEYHSAQPVFTMSDDRSYNGWLQVKAHMGRLQAINIVSDNEVDPQTGLALVNTVLPTLW